MKKLLGLLLVGLLIAPAVQAEDPWRNLTTQTVGNVPFSTGQAETLTGQFAASTRYIRVVCTVACFVAISGTTGSYPPTHGAANTATAAYLPAAEPAFMKVNGASDALTVIGSAAGTLYVTEIDR